MDIVKLSVRQPVTVAVGTILILLAGGLALGRLPIQLTPNVEDTIIAVRTFWEGASPQEIEQEIVDKQEEKLQSLSGLRAITSTSQQDAGTIRLQFVVGTPKDEALREVSEKLREVPDYPENAEEPVIEASDPENQDFIAWVVFGCTDRSVDVRTFGDFLEERVKPALDAVPGISEVNVLGGREREVQVRFDPVRLAQRGVTLAQLAAALRERNANVSGGEIAEGKSDVRLRTVGRYSDLHAIESTVVKHVAGAPVFVGDVADVVQDYKEPKTFVRSLGMPVLALNADREVGSNLITVMRAFQERVRELNAPGGLLDATAKQMGLKGELKLVQVYDQTIYIADALALVQDNIWQGGLLAVLVLLLFLRSARSILIISLAIPISIVGGAVAMVALGRTVNVISLAGMAFAVGMVVDNSIVVLENIFQHLERGKSPMRAAYDGAKEVWLAVLASTLTTLVVFIPILSIEEEAGQLFRDISLAICATISISLLVAVTVVPSASAYWLREHRIETRDGSRSAWRRGLRVVFAPIRAVAWPFRQFPRALAASIYALMGSVLARLAIVAGLSIVSVVVTISLIPPADYLPAGNRNLMLGLMIPPPGYNLAQEGALADRVEQVVAPYFHAGRLPEGEAYERAKRELPAVPTFDFTTMQPGPPVVPPPLENYFLVSFDGTLFQGGVSREPERAIDMQPLFQHASRPEIAPGVLGFAFQVPLFRLGGRTGSAVKIDVTGLDLAQVSSGASALYQRLVELFGPLSIQPEPSNFNLPSPELEVRPNDVRLAEAGLSPADLALTVQASGDGAVIGEYLLGGESIDLALIARGGPESGGPAALGETPVATASGDVAPLQSLAVLQRVSGPPQINRVARRRSVTLQLTPPRGIALQSALEQVEASIGELRASGAIPAGVVVGYTGSASKLEAVQTALLGNGTFLGTIGSSLFLAVLVVYLVMCVLYQSFVYPLVILFSVPLATMGGFLALHFVHLWSVSDRYMPVQTLDVLAMLGFIILIGVVVNNAILLVDQSLRNLRGMDGPAMPQREAIVEAVRSRVRPIFMSSFTSVGGLLPLVLMPGSGSELYRGLGAVVLGGLLVSTLFTLVLVPLLLSLVMGVRERWASRMRRGRSAARAEPATEL